MAESVYLAFQTGSKLKIQITISHIRQLDHRSIIIVEIIKIDFI